MFAFVARFGSPEDRADSLRTVPDLAAITGAPNWRDLSPRMGVAYDLFGNGKTALKGTLNRYVSPLWQGRV